MSFSHLPILPGRSHPFPMASDVTYCLMSHRFITLPQAFPPSSRLANGQHGICPQLSHWHVRFYVSKMNLFLWQNCSSVPPDSGNGPTIHPVAQIQRLPLIYFFLLTLHPFSYYVLLILPLTFLSNSFTSLHLHCRHPPLSHHPLPP